MIFVHFKFNNTLNKRDNLALRANFLTWYLAKVNEKPFFSQNTRKMCLFIERNERELIIRRRNGRRTMNKNKFDYQIVTEYHFLFLLPPLMSTVNNSNLIQNHIDWYNWGAFQREVLKVNSPTWPKTDLINLCFHQVPQSLQRYMSNVLVVCQKFTIFRILNLNLNVIFI